MWNVKVQFFVFCIFRDSVRIAHLAVRAAVGGIPVEPRWSWSGPAGSSGAAPSASTHRASAAGWAAAGSGWPQRRRPPGCRKWRRWRWWGRSTPQWPSGCSGLGPSAARPPARPRAPRDPPSSWRDALSDPSLSRPEGKEGRITLLRLTLQHLVTGKFDFLKHYTVWL